MAKFLELDSSRDLPFIPTGHEAFDSDGFVSPVAVLGADEAIELRAYFDWLIDAVVSADDPRNSYSINTYHLVCQRLYDLALDARILDLVEGIIGPDIVCWGSHLFAKLPHDGKEVPLHQDAVYWPFTSTRTVTVWLAIDDVDDENTAMQFVPGSHRAGPLPHDTLDLDGTRVLGRRVTGADTHTERFTNVLRAGHASMHSDLLLHGSKANTSDRRRAGLTLRYGAGDLGVQEGWEGWLRPAVHARGTIAGHWPNRDRPDGEHPEKLAAFYGDFDGTAL